MIIFGSQAVKFAENLDMLCEKQKRGDSDLLPESNAWRMFLCEQRSQSFVVKDLYYSVHAVKQ